MKKGQATGRIVTLRLNQPADSFESYHLKRFAGEPLCALKNQVVEILAGITHDLENLCANSLCALWLKSEMVNLTLQNNLRTPFQHVF